MVAVAIELNNYSDKLMQVLSLGKLAVTLVRERERDFFQVRIFPNGIPANVMIHWNRVGHLRCEGVAERKCGNYRSGLYRCGGLQSFFENEMRKLGIFQVVSNVGLVAETGAEEERKHVEIQLARVERRKLC